MFKRVVFIGIMIGLMQATTVHAAETQVYQFDTYEIRITLTRNDNELGYELVKVGTSPFSRMLFYPDSTIIINDVVDINGYHVLNGYKHEEGQDGYYDGFVTVLSPIGEEVTHLVFDYGLEEDVIGVYPVGNVIMVVVQSLEENNQGQYEFLQWTIHTFDQQYQEIDSTILIEDANTIEATNDLLLFDYDGDGSFDLGLDETLQPIRCDDPLPITSGQIFQGQVTLPFLNQGSLNQTTIYHGLEIDYPGYYELEYDDFVYPFTVIPNIENIQDGGVYNTVVTPHISSGQVLLNGDLYVSGTPISNPGFYELIIKGMGGYRQQLSFTITSNLSGIHHNGYYHDSVDVSFEGMGYLNNQFITSPHTISDPGEYLLLIQGENNYDESYVFTIEPEEESKTFIDFLQQYDLYILGVTLVSGFFVIKKK